MKGKDLQEEPKALNPVLIYTCLRGSESYWTKESSYLLTNGLQIVWASKEAILAAGPAGYGTICVQMRTCLMKAVSPESRKHSPWRNKRSSIANELIWVRDV